MEMFFHFASLGATRIVRFVPKSGVIDLENLPKQDSWMSEFVLIFIFFTLKASELVPQTLPHYVDQLCYPLTVYTDYMN